MSLPSGYLAWADARGINGHHPDEWAPDDLAAFYAFKLEWFKVKMRAFKAFGMPAIMPKDQMRSRIREDLDRVKALPPSRPYRTCPCHVFAPVSATPDTSPHGLDWLRSFAGKVPA